MTALTERYPELLPGEAPAEQVRLVAALDRAYTDAAPPALRAALRQVVQEHAATPLPLPGCRRAPGARRPVILAAAALLVLAAIAGGAHAVGLLLAPADRAITAAPLEHLVVEKNLGRVLNLSRAACGLTVTVTRVYADANRVVVGLTTTSTGRTPISLADIPRLTAGQGSDLPAIFALGGYAAPPGSAAGPIGSVTTYDGAAIAGAPRQVALRLVAPVRCHDGSLSGAIRPLRFTFTVPFSAGRATRGTQTVHAGGTAVTLVRLVATPLETRLYVRGTTFDNVTPTLRAGGRTLANVAGRAAGGLTIYTFEPLADAEKVVTVALEARSDGQPRLGGGPWIFHVTLP